MHSYLQKKTVKKFPLELGILDGIVAPDGLYNETATTHTKATTTTTTTATTTTTPTKATTIPTDITITPQSSHISTVKPRQVRSAHKRRSTDTDEDYSDSGVCL